MRVTHGLLFALLVTLAAGMVTITLAPRMSLAADGGPVIVAPPSLDAPVASAQASARRVMLGRSFFLVVRVVYVPGIEISLPTNLQFGGALEELRRTDKSQANADGTLTREFELEVMAFVTGEITIPPIEITYTGRGERSVVRTNPIAFEVSGVIGDGEGALRDIAPPVEVYRRDLTMLYVIIGIAIAIVLLVLLRILLRKGIGKRVAAGRLGRRILSPDEEALTRLDEIESRGATEQDDLKAVYLEMSEIIKTYIARRFSFPASELTTLEIRNELAARPSGEAAESMIRSWLESADLVKFANQRASSEDARASLNEARTFVEATRRQTDADGVHAAAPTAGPPKRRVEGSPVEPVETVAEPVEPVKTVAAETAAESDEPTETVREGDDDA